MIKGDDWWNPRDTVRKILSAPESRFAHMPFIKLRGMERDELEYAVETDSFDASKFIPKLLELGK